MYLIFSLVLFCIVLAALIDIITKDNDQIRHLPKLTWVLLVIFLPLIGSIIWFTVGREYSAPVSRGSFGDPRRWESTEPAATSTSSAKSTEEQLADLEREIAEHKRQERIRRLQADLEERRDQA
ncbi:MULTISPECIES: PLD nuclease N-terminal domain-containing protein [unclassified Diaminobutyricimonas]|uniref:PLD nuclease N-terminal domain-containing protein n=1 Tax=unclassified Diaminobutyricimonas TaxID=2643261 RepID=UPI0012F482C7|nr:MULTISPECIES: PLD nuclease N-terminal domain-containing protein [unclassified Diaminobutyricimonas]